METSAGQGEGDKINYAFTVTNTGHVTFYNVDVTDSLGGVTANGGRPIDAPLTGSVVAAIRGDMPMFGDSDQGVDLPELVVDQFAETTFNVAG